MMNETEFKKLPESQRKAIQQRLQDAGLYAGKIDGSWGTGTATALKQEEERRVDAEERKRANRLLETAAEADAEVKRAEAEEKKAEAEAKRLATERRQAYNEQANSPQGIATQIAANTAAPLAGYGVGRALGSGINAYADRSQASKNRVLEGAAEDRLRGLTTRDGARVGTTRSGAMPSENALLRVGGRMLPHTITGLGMMAKGGAMLSQGDEEDPFYPSMANRAAGLGMLGTGVGLIEQGANYAVNPGVAPDARSIAIMESNQLRRGGQLPAANRGQIIDAETVPDTPPPQRQLSAPTASEPAPGSRAYYAQEAKRLGVKGISRMNKADLVQAVNEANQNNATRRVRTKTPKAIPGIAGPAIAAGLAYMATPDDAMAADGGSVTGQDTALTNAALGGGTAYGANKLLQAMPRAVGGMANPAMAPQMVDAMTDYSPHERLRGRGFAAQNIPGARGLMQATGAFTPADEAFYEQSQVPPQNPRFAEQRSQIDADTNPALLRDQQLPGMVHGGADDFDAQLAELSALMSEFDVPETRQAPPMPQFQIPAPMQQNQLLAR